MTFFIQDAQKDLDDLSAGTLSDSQIRDIMTKIVKAYTSGYHNLLNDYKDENPEADGIDVELAVAKAAEKSRASNLLQKFTQAASDTIKARHPESYSAD